MDGDGCMANEEAYGHGNGGGEALAKAIMVCFCYNLLSSIVSTMTLSGIHASVYTSKPIGPSVGRCEYSTNTS